MKNCFKACVIPQQCDCIKEMNNRINKPNFYKMEDKPVDGEAFRIAKEALSEAWLAGAAEKVDINDLYLKAARAIEKYAKDQPYNK